MVLSDRSSLHQRPYIQGFKIKARKLPMYNKDANTTNEIMLISEAFTELNKSLRDLYSLR